MTYTEIELRDLGSNFQSTPLLDTAFHVDITFYFSWRWKKMNWKERFIIAIFKIVFLKLKQTKKFIFKVRLSLGLPSQRHKNWIIDKGIAMLLDKWKVSNFNSLKRTMSSKRSKDCIQVKRHWICCKYWANSWANSAESESRCGLFKGKLCMRVQRRKLDVGCEWTCARMDTSCFTFKR